MNGAIQLLLGLLGMACISFSFAVEIGLDQSNSTNSLIFSGEIKQGDSELLKPYIEKVRSNGNPRRFIIHSQGGNVTEAMKIGDLLRSEGFSVYEPRGVACISACVFAIMGGKPRILDGAIGLHPPLFLNISNNTPRVQALLSEGKQAMMEYAVRMNVDPQIVQEMYSLPNEADIQYLTKNQLKHYRLSIEP